MMPEQNWLMQSLADASKRAEELPRWARDVNSAVDEFYNRTSLQTRSDTVQIGISDHDKTGSK